MKPKLNKQIVKTSLRWVALLGAFIVAALYLNSSIYSAWVSGGPPNDYPEAWAQRSLLHLCFSISILLGGILLFRVIGSYPQMGSISIMLCTMILLTLSTPYIREFLDSDSCLDNGGRWNHAEYRCEK